MVDGAPQAQDSTNTKPRKPKMKRPNTRLLIALLILILLAVGGWFAYQYKEAQKDVERLSNPQEAAKAESAEITTKVALLVDLPQGETPTLATVSDVSKLQNQAFFAKAQNGDKVLIYTEAKRAILYRPSTNKVIEIAPINIGENKDKSSSESDSSSESSDANSSNDDTNN